jgi:transcriptional regulator NrdR family protein
VDDGAFHRSYSLTSVTIVINTTMEDFCTNNLNGKLYNADLTSATRHLLLNGSEVTSIEIGEMVLMRLRDLDMVSYIRFASVYREFKDIDSFAAEIKALSKKGRKIPKEKAND